MASPAINFRAIPPLDRHLAARTRTTGTRSVMNTVAADDLARYYTLLATELATVSLSRGQALAICDILNGATIDHLFVSAPVVCLAAELEDAVDDDLGDKWDIDLPALIAMVKTWRPAQALAVIDAVERWWAAESRDHEAALARVGLITLTA